MSIPKWFIYCTPKLRFGMRSKRSFDVHLHMILYYAMGGGLGHLTRSLAILRELPPLAGHVRLMASSNLASLVLPHAQCPVDIVAGDIISSKGSYLKFLDEYLKQHGIELIVLDTFPFGIVGEWLHIGENIPRLLIARYLKWEAYLKRVKNTTGPIPQYTLILEPPAKGCLCALKKYSQLTWLDGPIMLRTLERSQSSIPDKKDCLVIHSGNKAERQVLISLAKQGFGKNVTLDCIFPEREIYPAEPLIPHYKKIVSAAGYNMSAVASQSPPERTHLLHPFTRRFDDQFLRLRRFKRGLWKQQNNGAARQAAHWLLQTTNNVLY